jgi:hypothetical protein
MSARFRNRRILLNKDVLYEKFMEQRRRKSVRHLSSPTFPSPTPAQLREVQRVPHVWKSGDRYYKLALQYYGDASHWWVIGLFNQRPTEADLAVGDLINIPMPLENILRAYNS